jgi:hypothetical protein
VSIGSLQSVPWADQWGGSTATQPGNSASSSASATGPFAATGQAQSSYGASASNALWAGQDSTGTSAATTSPANPLQSLASDIQAMLIQAQSTAAGGGVTGSTTAAASPEQTAATDLQTMMGDIQSAIQSATTPNTQTANSNSTAPTGETEPAHHHHHHGGGAGEANGATAVASASTSSGTGASNAGSQLASDQAVSSIFATDIGQAIQAYGANSATSAMPALTV